MNLRDFSIERKFRLASSIVALSALVLSSGFVIANEWRNFRRLRLEDAQTITAIIAANSAAALVFDDPATARQILEGIRARPDAVSAALYGADGRLYESYPTNLAASALPAYAQGSQVKLSGRDLYAFEDVSIKGRRVGSAFVRFDISDAYRRFFAYIVVLGGIAAGCLLVVLWLSKLLHRWISSPILALRQTAHQIATEGNYSLRATKLGHDEVGDLVDAFNTMVDEVQAAQQRFRILADSAPVLIWVNGLAGCEFVNRPYLEFLGVEAADVRGQGWQQFAHPDDRERYLEAYARAAKHQAIFDAELRFRRRDGVYRWMRSVGRPRFDRSGEFLGYVGTTSDITDIVNARETLEQGRRELETAVIERTKELRATNDQLEAFVYSIAHDLRAPLRSVTGFSQLLLEDHANSLDASAQELLKRIFASSEFMDRLLLDLLAYGRAARAEIELGPVELKKAWDAALFQCATQIDQAQGRIEALGPWPSVIAHEATLGQCLANLLSNALKFVAPGTLPHIRLWTEERGPMVRIWLEDNGVGIPADQHERIFRIFERLDGARYPGTGIGLSIVRKGAERMNGQVGLEPAPKQGTRFWIELPKASREA